MQHLKSILIILACVALGTACHSSPSDRPVRLVPGAEHIRLTSSPAEMAQCKRMGDVYPADMDSPRQEFRNHVADLGGNAALVTAGTVKLPLQGVAYQCP
jgi:hypothetical protein